MQSLCNQSVARKMSWSVGRVAGVMINAACDAGVGSQPGPETAACYGLRNRRETDHGRPEHVFLDPTLVSPEFDSCTYILASLREVDVR
jgi:hypothetical protein